MTLEHEFRNAPRQVMMGMGSSTSFPDRSGLMSCRGPSVSTASMQHNSMSLGSGHGIRGFGVSSYMWYLRVNNLCALEEVLR